jgi:hypothetical protein
MSSRQGQLRSSWYKDDCTWEALGTVWLQEFDMKAEMLDERTTDYLPNKL